MNITPVSPKQSPWEEGLRNPDYFMQVSQVIISDNNRHHHSSISRVSALQVQARQSSFTGIKDRKPSFSQKMFQGTTKHFLFDTLHGHVPFKPTSDIIFVEF